MNAQYICRNPRSYNLTEGNTYEALLPIENDRICLRNDNSRIAFYALNLFELVTTETPTVPEIPTPAPTLTEAEIIASINVVRDAARVRVSFKTRNDELKDYDVTYLTENRLDASCGIGDITGINNLSSRIAGIVEDDFDLDMEDYEELRKKLFKMVLSANLTRLCQNQSRAMYLISTALAGESLSDEIHYEVLEEECTQSTDEIDNPNSGNPIKLWIFAEDGGMF